MKFVWLLLLLPCSAWCQLPETRIYLFDLQRTGKTWTVQNAQLVSKNTGYNNQPSFNPEGTQLYFSSSLDSTNTELYAYDLTRKRKRLRRITHTKEPEYSPKLTLEEDRFSCVSVEKDKTTQHLYTYSLRGKKPQIILPELKTIGYYEWISPYEFVSFELPEPFFFVKHNLNNLHADTLANGIGRTFYFYRNKSRIVYVDKSDSMNYKIRLAHPIILKNKQLTEEEKFLSETLPREEDFCIMQDGSLLQGHDGILYMKKNPFRNKKEEWVPLADLKKFGIKKFQRIAISNDNTKIAIVALP
jgi:hypothetical protein